MKRTLVILICALLLLSGCAGEITETAQEPEETVPETEITAPAETPPPTATPEPTPLPEGPGQSAAEQLELVLDTDETAAKRLLDGVYQTDYTFEAGTEITLSAEEEIGSLYLIFGTYPGEWTLSVGNETLRCGTEGFLHEYVQLPRGAKSVTICLPAAYDVMIRDLYAFTEGYPPDFVQTWSNLEDGADILVFSTHTDDELLWFGGLIPYYSMVRGLKVQVVYMTSNYMTDFQDYRFRPHEALNGLWVAGTHYYPVTNEVGDYMCYDYWNAVNTYGANQFTEFQVEQIRRFKPLVVVTQAEDGEYGHGAHILCAYSVEAAVKAAANREQFTDSAEKYGVWNTPKTYLHKYGNEEDMTWLSYENEAPELGWRTPFAVAQEAYRQHLTQQQWEGFYVASFGHPQDSHQFGLYRSLVGPDTEKNDLMEHVSRELFPID